MQPLIGVAQDGHVGEVVVEQGGHAGRGALDDNVAVEELGAVGAVFEEAVELVDVLHGHLETLAAEEHVLEARLDVVVCALQEAVELVDVVEQDVGDMGNRLLHALVQQVDAKDNLGGRLEQGVEVALGVVSPVARVAGVPGELLCVVVSAQQLLACLDRPGGGGKGHMARLAGCVEHRLFKRGLHRRQRVDGECGREDARVGVVGVLSLSLGLGLGLRVGVGLAAKGNHG